MARLRDRRRGRAALRSGLLVLALAIAGIAHARMDTASKVAGGGEVFVPRPDEARFGTLGFDALASDFYWLQAVQILGGERAGVGGKGPLLARLIDLVTTLDPWVGHPYRFAGVWLTESLDDVLAANALLERGIAYHPGDWRNRHYLGFNHFFYLGDDQRAAEILEQAVGLPKAPRYLGSLVATLRLSQGGLETAATFLRELARQTDDEFERAEYLKSLDEIDTERLARLLDRAREEFRRRHGRDIESVEELVEGPLAVLHRLPPAHPHFPGFGWKLHEETGEIVSTFYKARYRKHMQHVDRERQERYRRELEQRAAQGAAT